MRRPFDRRQLGAFVSHALSENSGLGRSVSDRVIDAWVAQLGPKYWFRADNVTGPTTGITRINNKMGSDYLTVTGTLAQTTSSLVGGRSVLTFTGTQTADSNLPPSSFKFLHDGAATEHHHESIAAASAQVLWSTRSGFAVGINVQVTSDSMNDGITNGTAFTQNITNTGGSALVNTAGQVAFTYSETASPKWSAYSRGVLQTSGSVTTNAPSGADPSKTLRIGADGNGANPWIGSWVESIFFDRVLSAFERAVLNLYFYMRYTSAEEKAVQALAPVYWFRADNIVGTSAAVTRLNNKAPGATDFLANAGTALAVSGSDPGLNNKPSLDFNGVAGQRMSSSLGNSSFDFMNNGTGMYVAHVFVPETLATVVVCSNGDSTRYQQYFDASGNSSVVVTSFGTPILTAQSSGGLVAGTSVFTEFSYIENATPEYALYTNGTLVASGTTSAPPQAASSGPFTLGATTAGTIPANMRWAESIMLNRVPAAAERAAIRAYVQMWYNR